MKHSDQVNEIAKALCKAQLEMGAASKSSVNPHFKSKYAALPEVMDVAKVLNKHGLAYVQPTRSEGGNVTVETVLIHGESGQWLSGELTLTPQQNTPQGVGSAVTYGRRFALCSLVGIVADEDDDGNAASQRQPTKSAPSGNGNGHDAKAMEAQIEARLAAECEKGFASWAAKRDWRDANKTAKEALPREAQLRLSQKWAQAKPIGLAENAT
jgi:ERF superfamily